MLFVVYEKDIKDNDIRNGYVSNSIDYRYRTHYLKCAGVRSLLKALMRDVDARNDDHDDVDSICCVFSASITIDPRRARRRRSCSCSCLSSCSWLCLAASTSRWIRCVVDTPGVRLKIFSLSITVWYALCPLAAMGMSSPCARKSQFSSV